MTKIIKLKPMLVESCAKCPYKWIVWQGIFNTKMRYFCTSLSANIAEVKGGE